MFCSSSPSQRTRKRVLGRLRRVERLERNGEIGALEGHWKRAVDGRGGLIVITGEAGSGKSTLVDAFLARCPEARALWGGCDQLATPRPLGPVHDLTPQLGDLTRGESGEQRPSHEVYEAVFAALAAEPSVLVVEDLHWADQATIDLLRFLLRRIGTIGSLVIGTVRDDEIDPAHPLRALLGDVGAKPACVDARRPSAHGG